MNNKEIIESGKLELYVCGALSEREMREIALLANLNPELKEEIAHIENNLVSFAESFEQQPAGDTFDKIQKKIKAGNKTFQVDFKTRRFNWVNAAGIAGFLLMSAVSIYFWQQNVSLKKQVNTLSQLTDTISLLKKEAAVTSQQLEFINRASTRKFKLAGIDGNDSLHQFVLLYWCQITRDVVLNPGNLPKPPEGKQYQLWAMFEGKAIDAGTIKFDSGTDVQQMKNIPRADAFCITLENTGGSTTPTMEEVKILSKI